MSFFVTGGTMQNDAESYVERPADKALLAGLLEGEFCYILTSRQMGKSSLMVRAANRLEQIGVETALIDLTEIGGENVTPEQWYFGLLEGLSQALDLEEPLELYWLKHSHLSPVQRLMNSIENVVLPTLAKDRPPNSPELRLAIFVDEIDVVRSIPFSTDEFFASIRSCYNRRSQDPRLNAVTFCLIGVASPSDLIQDPRTTPFNIGTRIVIEDFAEDQVSPLREGFERLGIPSTKTATILERVLYWTHGHPYLTQRLCRAVTENYQARFKSGSLPLQQSASEWVDQACEQILIGDRSRETDDNLIFVREQILRYEGDTADLLRLYERIRNRQRIAHDQLDPAIERLLLAGVIRRQHKRLAVRNRVYEQVFDTAWIEANMPKAELLRERDRKRSLVRLGLVLASASALIVLLVSVFVMLRLTDGLHAEIQRKNLSIQLGARQEALIQIKESAWTSLIPSYRTQARDLALAALTTPDLRSNTPLEFQLPGDPFTLSHQADRYAIARADGQVQVYSTSHRLVYETAPDASPFQVTRLAWSPDDGHLAIQGLGDATPKHFLLDLKRRLSVELPPRANLACHLEFSPDSQSVCAGWEDGTLQIYDLDTLLVRNHWEPNETSTSFSCLRFSPDGSLILTANNGSLDIKCFALSASSKELTRIRQTSTPSFPVDLEWHPSGQHIVIAEIDGTLRWWDFLNAPPRFYKKLQGTHTTTDLNFSRNGLVLAAICPDTTLRLWRPYSGKELLQHSVGPASGLQIGHRNRFLTFVEESTRRLRSYHLTGTDGLSTFSMPNPNPTKLPSMAFGPNDILVAANGGTVSGWRIGSPEQTFSLPIKPTSSVSFRQDQTGLYTAGGRGLLEVPINETSSPSGTIVEFDNPIAYHLPTGLESLTISTNGIGAALRRGTADEKLLLFRLDQSQEHQIYSMDRSHYQLSMSPSGRWLAASSNETDSQVRVWKLTNQPEDGSIVMTDIGSVSASRHFSFSADESWIATATKKHIYITPLDQWPKQGPVTFPHHLSGTDYIPVAFGTLLDSRMQILAAAIDLDTVKVFEVPVGKSRQLKPLFTLKTPSSDPLVNLSFSPHSRYLAARTTGAGLFVWHLDSLTSSLVALGIGSDLPNFKNQDALVSNIEFQNRIDRHRLRPPHLFLPFRWTKIYELDHDIARTTEFANLTKLKQEQQETIQRLGLPQPLRNRSHNAAQFQLPHSTVHVPQMIH